MWQQRFMAIFIGVIMVASVAGFALISQPPSGPKEVVVPDVIEHELTPDERVSILRTGKTLIEYYYQPNCTECMTKKDMYESFVLSDEIKGYAVLATAESSLNTTSDFITGINGDRFDLKDITTREELQELFCNVALTKPTICILQEI